MNRKNIEIGCICMVINSQAGNNGAIVSPVEYLGDRYGIHSNPNVWMVDKVLQQSVIDPAPEISECYLQRIDDGQLDFSKEEVGDDVYNTTIKEKTSDNQRMVRVL